ncbi:MAG: anti-sigma factor antagonist [Clostridia bacterium]|nr:anti-sigma factor antagonist [Clostridia bacterium]
MNVLTAIYNYSDGILTVKLNGEIDHHSVRDIRVEIDRQICFYRAREVLLDLEAVSFMDSSGLGLILGRYTRVKENGGTLKVQNPGAAAQRVLRLAGTDKIIPVVFNRDEHNS